MTTPSKRSMERAGSIVSDIMNDVALTPDQLEERIALAFDRLVEEACEVVDSLASDIHNEDVGPDGIVKAIRLKLKGGEDA